MPFLVSASPHHVDWEHSSSSYLGTVRMWRLALKCPLRVATYDKANKNTGSKFLIQREKADKWELLDSSHADIDILIVIIDILMVWHRYLHSSSFTDNFIQHACLSLRSMSSDFIEWNCLWMKICGVSKICDGEHLWQWSRLSSVNYTTKTIHHHHHPKVFSTAMLYWIVVISN